MKPRIFVSTVTSEFKTARTKIEHVLEFLGYEVVQQDIFGTEGGDLRQMLREKIDSCDALIQLAGDAYGAEPPTVDPDYARVSYTQFEFLYARLQGKKTYVLFAGPACHKDTALPLLDLPRQPNHPDPTAHQAELRDLQSAYRARLRSEGHLWHSPADDTALENAILKLRNDSEQLRTEFRDWQKSLAKTQTRNTRSILLLAALVLLLGIGGYIAWQSTRTQLTEISQPKPLDKSRLREHLTTASEKALARDLAEANAIQGDWEKRQKFTDAAQAAHQQRLSRVAELAEEFATLETGENASTTLTEMLRILDEQGIDSALAYLSSQSTRLLQKATAKAEAARNDLQPLLTGAQLAIANGQPEKAETLFQQLLTPGLPDWPQARHQYIVYLIWTKGPRQQTHGTLAAAKETYREAERHSRLLTLQEPENTLWHSYLAVSLDNLGDITLRQGNISAAKSSYTASLEIRQVILDQNPDDIRVLTHLSISHEKLGKIAEAQGNNRAARAAYTASLDIRKHLVVLDNKNKQLRSDLSISYDLLSHLAVRDGDLVLATEFCSAALEIRNTLAKQSSKDTLLRRDISFSYDRLGDIAKGRGDSSTAAACYTKAFEIRAILASSDPANSEWQRYLMISHLMLGILSEEQNNLPAAKDSFLKAVKIAKALTIRDLKNTYWQRDLLNCQNKLGDIAMAQGDLHAATKAYTAGLEIANGLTARDPENTNWQRDLFVSYYKLANLAEKQEDENEARKRHQQCHDILQTVVDKGKHVTPADIKNLARLKQYLGLE